MRFVLLAVVGIGAIRGGFFDGNCPGEESCPLSMLYKIKVNSKASSKYNLQFHPAKKISQLRNIFSNVGKKKISEWKIWF